MPGPCLTPWLPLHLSFRAARHTTLLQRRVLKPQCVHNSALQAPPQAAVILNQLNRGNSQVRLPRVWPEAAGHSSGAPNEDGGASTRTCTPRPLSGW